MASPTRTSSEELLKDGLAGRFLAEIVNGSLSPGERIVERVWAQKFGVAQASIREAINILEKDGFVTKESGQSARVINLSEKDVVQLYQVRGALEGLAAYQAALSRPDVSELNSIVMRMRTAAAENDADELVDSDLKFHLQLCKLADNPHLEEHAVRILLPFFAFFRLRLSASKQGVSTWDKDVEAHQKIVDLIAEGEAELAEHYVRKAIGRFTNTANKNWIPHDNQP
jgi:DNA-binding GntR family transcriptional regulator